MTNQTPAETVEGLQVSEAATVSQRHCDAAAEYLDAMEQAAKTGVRVTGVLPCADGSPHPLAQAFARFEARLTQSAPDRALVNGKVEKALRAAVTHILVYGTAPSEVEEAIIAQIEEALDAIIARASVSTVQGEG